MWKRGLVIDCLVHVLLRRARVRLVWGQVGRWEMEGRRVYFSCCRAMVFWILEVFEAMMRFAKV